MKKEQREMELISQILSLYNISAPHSELVYKVKEYAAEIAFTAFQDGFACGDTENLSFQNGWAQFQVGFLGKEPEEKKQLSENEPLGRWVNLSTNFTEDWQMKHCRFAVTKAKMDTSLFELKGDQRRNGDGFLQKEGAIGYLPLSYVEYLVYDHSQSPVLNKQEAKDIIEGFRKVNNIVANQMPCPPIDNSHLPEFDDKNSTAEKVSTPVKNDLPTFQKVMGAPAESGTYYAEVHTQFAGDPILKALIVYGKDHDRATVTGDGFTFNCNGETIVSHLVEKTAEVELKANSELNQCMKEILSFEEFKELMLKWQPTQIFHIGNSTTKPWLYCVSPWDWYGVEIVGADWNNKRPKSISLEEIFREIVQMGFLNIKYVM